MINLSEGYLSHSDSPKFVLGEVVVHKKYDYRGVIVEYDLSCKADENWYQSNQTQPDRNQPWYHVLVDGSKHTTYVAQANLSIEVSGKPIVHPMLNLFFDHYDEKAKSAAT